MNRRAISGFSALVLGLALGAAGCDKAGASGAPSSSSATATAEAAAPPNVRRIDIAATNDGYSPSSVDVKKGEEVVLRFTRKTKSDCLAQVKIPKLGITKDLPIDKPVEIAIKPDADGDIPFECGMSMVHGKIHVGS